jgi:hypothetical protein
MMSWFTVSTEDWLCLLTTLRMGASREQIAAAAAEASTNYEVSRRQVVDFETTAQASKVLLLFPI